MNYDKDKYSSKQIFKYSSFISVLITSFYIASLFTLYFHNLPNFRTNVCFQQVSLRTYLLYFIIYRRVIDETKSLGNVVFLKPTI